jgi:hypothetical protein
VILALFACAPREAVEAEAPTFTPEWGDWTAQVGDTWEGSCVLEDMRTYEHPEQAWELGPYRDAFYVLDEVGYWTACTRLERAFDCPLPVIADDFTEYGYDLAATYTPRWTGTFDDTENLTGVYRVDATCEGEDCDLLTGYGEDYVAPCTVEAPLRASAD